MKIQRLLIFEVVSLKIYKVAINILKIAFSPAEKIFSLFMFLSLLGEMHFAHKIINVFDVFISVFYLGIFVGQALSLIGIFNTSIAVLFNLIIRYIGGKINENNHQKKELEADKYAMHVMRKAGYDPKATLLWNEGCMKEKNKKDPPSEENDKIFMEGKKIFGNFKTHPTHERRLSESKKTLKEMGLFDNQSDARTG